MAEERTSNYIKLCDEWAEKFLQMEKKELMNRLPELKEEDGYLKITHFGVPFGIRLDNGRIDRLDGRAKANTTEMLNIYTLLGYVKENAFFMDKWVPFADATECTTVWTGIQDWCNRCFCGNFFRSCKRAGKCF